MSKTMNLRERELAESPGLARPDLIPEGVNAELDELRAEHVRLLAERDEAAQEGYRLHRAFEAEDEAVRAALDGQVRGEKVKLPASTPPEGRRDALWPVKMRLKAINRALVEHGERILDTAEERHDAWLQELDAVTVETTRRVEEALQAVAEAAAEEGQVERVEAWISRLAGYRGVRGGLETPARWNSAIARLQPFPDFMERTIDPDRLEELKKKLSNLAAAKETTTDA